MQRGRREKHEVIRPAQCMVELGNPCLPSPMPSRAYDDQSWGAPHLPHVLVTRHPFSHSLIISIMSSESDGEDSNGLPQAARDQLASTLRRLQNKAKTGVLDTMDENSPVGDEDEEHQGLDSKYLTQWWNELMHATRTV